MRWYQIGLVSQSNIERLLAFFVGVEIVVSTFCRITIGKIETERYKKALLSLGQAKPKPSKEVLQFIKQSISQVPLQIRFETYRERSGISNANGEISQFMNLKRLRDRIAHGEATSITELEASQARDLIEAILRHELKVTANPSKEWPSVFSVALNYFLDPSNAPPLMSYPGSR